MGEKKNYEIVLNGRQIDAIINTIKYRLRKDDVLHHRTVDYIYNIQLELERIRRD